MPKDFESWLGFIANWAAILTAFIAIIFYFKTLKKGYYLNDIPGDYKIFSGLKNNENATVLNQIKISFVSNKGWFFGFLQYSEIFEDDFSKSSGEASVFGRINYSYWKNALNLFRMSSNPLVSNYLNSYKGTIYFLSRNDLDITNSNWSDFIIQQYSVIHYKDAHRFKLFNPVKTDSYLQLPTDLILINIDKIPEQMLQHNISD